MKMANAAAVNNNAEVFLPLHVAGVRNDAILLVDRVECI